MKRQTSFERIIENYNANRNNNADYTKEGQSVVAEFERFDDKDLHLLHTIVEVY